MSEIQRLLSQFYYESYDEMTKHNITKAIHQLLPEYLCKVEFEELEKGFRVNLTFDDSQDLTILRLKGII